MTTLESTSAYGVGVANRFMLLEDESQDSESEVEMVEETYKSNKKVHDKAKQDKKDIKNETHDNHEKHQKVAFADNLPKQTDKPKREFDRHSGSDKTGVKPVDKKQGSGGHNWGNAQDSWKQEVDDSNATLWKKEDDLISPLPSDVQEPMERTAQYINESLDSRDADKLDSPDEAGVTPVIPEIETMTLDEYRALEQARISKPEYRIRQPGEGEDKAKWKGTYVLKKADISPLKHNDNTNNATNGTSTITASHHKGKKEIDILATNIKLARPTGPANRRGGFNRGASNNRNNFGSNTGGGGTHFQKSSNFTNQSQNPMSNKPSFMGTAGHDGHSGTFNVANNKEVSDWMSHQPTSIPHHELHKNSFNNNNNNNPAGNFENTSSTGMFNGQNNSLTPMFNAPHRNGGNDLPDFTSTTTTLNDNNGPSASFNSHNNNRGRGGSFFRGSNRGNANFGRGRGAGRGMRGGGRGFNRGPNNSNNAPGFGGAHFKGTHESTTLFNPEADFPSLNTVTTGR